MNGEWRHALMAGLVALAEVVLGFAAFALIIGAAVFLIWLFGQSI